MEFKIIRQGELKTTNWSGGTTTELFIYPEGSVYSEGNFLWRLSTAKVEMEESVFTRLPGVSRVLMVLEGKLGLEHENHHKAVLDEFQQDSFMGDWTTRGFGRVRDFNLMMKRGCRGSLEAVFIQEQDILSLPEVQASEDFEKITEVLYAAKGTVEIIIGDGDEIYTIHKGDVAAVTRLAAEKGCEIKLQSKGPGEGKIIKSIILY